MKIGLILSAGALAVAAVAVAAMPLQDAKAKSRDDHGAMAGMDKAAMQAEMEKAGALGPQHAELKRMVGTWSTKVKMWEDPSQPPQESNGTSTMEMAMGGRQLIEHFSGTMMGQPYEGMGILGYNNSTGEFEHVWMDTMNTGKLWSHGTKAADGTVTMMGEMTCAMGPQKMRMVTTHADGDSQHFEMYCTMAGMPEMKVMEIDYTRGASR